MGSPTLKDFAKAVPYPVQKRLLSILDGYHQGERVGHSHEFLDLEDYRPGDPIADVDWRATARAGHPIIKRFEATAVLTVMLAVDAGSSMAALAPGESGVPVEKVRLAGDIEKAIVWLVAMHGDHLGLVAGNAVEMRTLPARTGLGHGETLLRIAQAINPDSGSSDFLAVLRRVRAGSKKRSLILGITDETQITGDVVAALNRLTQKHKVGLFLIEDFDPTKGSGDISDVASGLLPDFVGTDEAIRLQWEQYTAARRRHVDQLLSAVPLRYARVGAEDEVLPALIRVLGGLDRGPDFA